MPDGPVKLTVHVRSATARQRTTFAFYSPTGLSEPLMLSRSTAESGETDFIVTLNPSDFPQSRLKAEVIAPTDPLPSRRRKPRPRRTRLVIRKK